MKRLLLMRHAKSSHDDPNLSDHDRPLNERGKRVAPLMGSFLKDQDCVPDLILTSTATRAEDTANLVASTCGKAIPVAADPGLYQADVDDFCDVLYQSLVEENIVMVIAHNPGIERWVYALTKVYESMPTGAIANIALPKKFVWEDLTHITSGELAHIWRPREVLPDHVHGDS